MKSKREKNKRKQKVRCPIQGDGVIDAKEAKSLPKQASTPIKQKKGPNLGIVTSTPSPLAYTRLTSSFKSQKERKTMWLYMDVNGSPFLHFVVMLYRAHGRVTSFLSKGGLLE